LIFFFFFFFFFFELHFKECQKKAYKYHKSECLLIKEHPELGNYAFKVMNQILLKIEDDEKVTSVLYNNMLFSKKKKKKKKKKWVKATTIL